jgi:AefR-like transcriptional repressor, C-terminal domain
MAYADLGLDADVVSLQRIILQETGQFPGLTAAFYDNGIVRTTNALTKWLRLQVKRGLIVTDNPEEAAGMLIGMVASAPQRAAIYGGVPLPSRAQIKARVQRCVKLFLHGCDAKGRAP